MEKGRTPHELEWLKVISEYHKMREHWDEEQMTNSDFCDFMVKNFEPPVRKNSEEAETIKLLLDRKKFVDEKILKFGERYGAEGKVIIVGSDPRVGKTMHWMKTAMEAILMDDRPTTIAFESTCHKGYAQGEMPFKPFEIEPIKITPVERFDDKIFYQHRTNPNPENRPDKSRKQRNKPRR